ncbi:YbaB/EbfC family nucleoid-associated protein [Saccharothrix sp. 6-C]|uniref:DNA-binding protein YbaB n=1 Tax=Saccharothrix texasensis TaxID=103734 RepID=A0A3N1H8W0_9PSEU|nr:MULTISPECIES: YbaB/EbfC family nucleoid-associated protein [Saccharothrix]QQQ76968.1 YbaB/EbfC family nucleoid-associated protein [Saccharothrix sp. 6-C]ROP38702.1 DNA-binding protein YbaB [Saccharothrix texasensis]
MEPDQWLAQYGEKIEQAKRNAAQAETQLGGVGGSATSPDGLVTVTVNASGALTDLILRPQLRGEDPERISGAIMTAVAQAQRAAAGKVVEIMTEFVGDSPALEFVKAKMPNGYSGDGTDAVEPEPELQRRDTRPDDDYFTNPPDVMA